MVLEKIGIFEDVLFCMIIDEKEISVRNFSKKFQFMKRKKKTVEKHPLKLFHNRACRWQSDVWDKAALQRGARQRNKGLWSRDGERNPQWGIIRKNISLWKYLSIRIDNPERHVFKTKLMKQLNQPQNAFLWGVCLGWPHKPLSQSACSRNTCTSAGPGL